MSDPGLERLRLGRNHGGYRGEWMIAAVGEVCPIDRSPVIEGRPARGGIIRPVVNLAERLDWPEAFYLVRYKTPVSYTLEAPSDYPLELRVRALKRAVRAAMGNGQ